MTETVVAPYGSWSSPFAIDRLTDGVVFLSEISASGGVRWWIEGRPEERGQQALVRRDPDGTVTRLTPPGFNVRSRVHEYGGGASLVAGEQILVSDFASGRLHRVVAAGEVEAVTPDRPWRFADLEPDLERRRVFAVREDHDPDVVAQHGEWRNELVSIGIDDGAVQVVASGADFYAAPRRSPDGRSLAWLEWRHPNMPWDGTELKVAPIAADGTVGPGETAAGSPGDWVSQPRWSPDGILHFVAEPDGWMNIQRRRDGRTEPVLRMAAEFAAPDWQFGNRGYDFTPDGGILAIARSDGQDRLYRIAPDGTTATIEVDATELTSLHVDGARVVLRAAAPAQPASIIELDPGSGAVTVLRRAAPSLPDPEDVSVGRHVDFPTTGGRTAHGNYYAPRNATHRAPEGDRPPLVVMIHGGPTSAAFSGFQTGIQLFTSRGFAVLDVDYGGSTGYGRAYRKQLDGAWGVVDVDDCVAGATWLAEQGLAASGQLAIRGGSAGGFTTLAALAFRRTFSAGTSNFGLGDLRSFVRDTHKFESRYMEGLIGPWPEAAALYEARSPGLHADQINAPVLVQQGAEDRVVPPQEAELIVAALRARRIPHVYNLFPGEDHGFRGRDAIIRSFSSELSFYGQVFGFEPADPIEPVRVAFLDEWRARLGAP